jgi:hypothetical protein
MATHEADAASTVSRLFGSLWRIVLVLTFTGVETVALVGWLGLVEGVPTASRAAALGLAVLICGLLLEHYLTDLAVNGRSGTFPFWKALGFSVSEALLWAVWLRIAERLGGVTGIAVAGIVLTVLLVPQHTIEDNVLRGRGLFERVINPDTFGFSLVEAVGGSVWLLFVFQGDLVRPLLANTAAGGVDPALIGVGLLAATLLVEHGIAVSLARRS